MKKEKVKRWTSVRFSEKCAEESKIYGTGIVQGIIKPYQCLYTREIVGPFWSINFERFDSYLSENLWLSESKLEDLVLAPTQ